MRRIRWTAVSIYKNKNYLMYLGCKYPTCHGVIQWNVFYLFFDSLLPTPFTTFMLPEYPVHTLLSDSQYICLFTSLCWDFFLLLLFLFFFILIRLWATWEQNLECQYIFGKGKWIKEKMNDYMNEWINECC